MDFEDVKEWREKQYMSNDPNRPFLQFDIDCVDWLIAEVERLRAKLEKLGKHWND